MYNLARSEVREIEMNKGVKKRQTKNSGAQKCVRKGMDMEGKESLRPCTSRQKRKKNNEGKDKDIQR